MESEQNLFTYFLLRLTDGFFLEGIRNGAMLSPSISAGLALHS